MALIDPTTTSIPAQVKVGAIKEDGTMSDDTALAIYQKDVRADEDYMARKMWTLRWREIDTLYQSPRPISMWEGTMTQEANVQSFLVAKHTNAIVPAVMSSIFFQEPFFMLRTTPSMTEEIIRQKTTLFSAMFREMEFENTCWDGWFYTVLFGTAIFKWGTQTYPKDRPVYRRKGPQAVKHGQFSSVRLETKDSKEIEVDDRTQDFWCPEICHIPNEEVLVDCTLEVPDIRKAKRVTHVKYMSGYDLLDMIAEHRDENGKIEDGWSDLSAAEIRSWFEPPREQPGPQNAPASNMMNSSIVIHAQEPNMSESGDPLMNVLKVAEKWTKRNVTMVVQDKRVIRNGKNPYGKVPFYSSHWWRIPRSFWSLGIGHLAGQEQRVDQGTRNAALNILSMAVNPPMLRLQTENQPGQNIRLRRGAIISVTGTDDVRKGWGVMDMPQIPASLPMMLQNANSAAEEATGADQRLMQGNTSGAGTSMGRTAGGAMQLAAAQAGRLQGPVSRFVYNVLTPWIYQVDELINEQMPEKQIAMVLGDELGQQYEDAFDLEKYLHGRSKFEVLAAQHLAAKKSAAQLLPLLAQIFENQQLLSQLNQLGWTVDALEMVNMFMEISEWTNRRDLIRRMNPQEMQFMQAMKQQAGQQKLGQQIAIDNNRARNTSDLNSEKNDARATDITLRHALEQSIAPDIGLTTGETERGQ